MKYLMTEEELKYVVGRGIMETVDRVMLQRGTTAHFNEKSKTVTRLKKLGADTGWDIVGYTNNGDEHSFVMCANSDQSMPFEAFLKRASIMYEDLAKVEPYGQSCVKFAFDIKYNPDYLESQKYAQGQLDNPMAWKTPWNLGGQQ